MKLALAAIGLLAFILLPWFTSTYVISLAFALFLTAALAQSYDWVGGHLGYMNLGHAAFFGIGAYAFGIIFARGGGLQGGLHVLSFHRR